MTEQVEWRALISSLDNDARFSDGASEASLAALERAVGVSLPDELKAVLRESDGVNAGFSPVIFPCAEIGRLNQEMRTHPGFKDLYMPFDNLLIFGAEVNSDFFAYGVAMDGQIHGLDIYKWDHECDGRPWYAASMRRFLQVFLDQSET